MSAPYNPYQTPQYPPPYPPAQQFGYPPAQAVSAGGIWRKGDILVLDKHAQLPQRCVKSNLPAERYLKRNLSWHHPLLAISVLASPIIYIILAAILSKRATIHVGLTDEWYARRRMRIIITWVLALVSGAMMLGGCVLADQLQELTLLFLLGGLILFIGALIFGSMAARLVYPAKITDTHVFLKGVNAQYLDGLPEWPYPV
jgi:hypothetical protein